MRTLKMIYPFKGGQGIKGLIKHQQGNVMKFLFYLFFCGLLLVHSQSQAENEQLLIETQAYYNSQGQKKTLIDVIQSVQAGDVLIVGENHGQLHARAQQLELLASLRQKGFQVSLGMEFFTYTDQLIVDQYLQNQITEEDFLQQIAWGKGIAYRFYKDQVLSQNRALGERTIALNAPRSITGQVAKKGLESLSDEQKSLLPPHLTMGRDSYRDRFISQMPHLPNPEAAQRYFTAQSIWDDTMAWQTELFMKNNSEQVFVIIVGDFHVQFGGGLPDRIQQRTGRRPLVLSYQSASELNPTELVESILEHPVYGSRADFIWVAE